MAAPLGLLSQLEVLLLAGLSQEPCLDVANVQSEGPLGVVMMVYVVGSIAVQISSS